MYWRQSSKWKEFLLQEGVEDIGLPPTIAHYLRQQNEAFGPVENKHLTWIGQLVKSARSDLLLPRENRREIGRQLVQAVRTTLKKRGGDESMAAEKELYDEALSPLVEFTQSAEGESPSVADIKKFKKRFMKNLRKLEINPQFIRGFDSYVDNRMKKGVEEAFMKYVKPIMLLLAEDPVSYEVLRGEIDLRGVGVVAKDILDNPPHDPDKVIHEFDNGYYWYDIGSAHCDTEAKQMGHCGSADEGTLYSLRVGEKRSVKRMILLAFDGSTVYQVKANANAAPKEHLWRYVDWFLENMDVEHFAETGKHSKDEIGFAEMISYLKNKHKGQINFGTSWNIIATKLINHYEGTIEQDSDTTLKIYYPPGPTEDAGPAEVHLYHHAWWPVKDVVVDEETFRIRMLIKQEAQLIANDTLYPNPHVTGPAKVYARGKRDRDAAMLEIVLVWTGFFEPHNDTAESTKEAEVLLGRRLEEFSQISRWLTDYEAAPEEDDFDYNGFLEGVQEKLEEHGAYRDIAAEQDAETERARAADRGQMDLPLRQSAGEMDLDYGLSESRIIQRWQQIIK
jgi:hypothetical protein